MLSIDGTEAEVTAARSTPKGPTFGSLNAAQAGDGTLQWRDGGLEGSLLTDNERGRSPPPGALKRSTTSTARARTRTIRRGTRPRSHWPARLGSKPSRSRSAATRTRRGERRRPDADHRPRRRLHPGEQRRRRRDRRPGRLDHGAGRGGDGSASERARQAVDPIRRFSACPSATPRPAAARKRQSAAARSAPTTAKATSARSPSTAAHRTARGHSKAHSWCPARPSLPAPQLAARRSQHRSDYTQAPRRTLRCTSPARAGQHEKLAVSGAASIAGAAGDHEPRLRAERADLDPRCGPRRSLTVRSRASAPPALPLALPGSGLPEWRGRPEPLIDRRFRGNAESGLDKAHPKVKVKVKAVSPKGAVSLLVENSNSFPVKVVSVDLKTVPTRGKPSRGGIRRGSRAITVASARPGTQVPAGASGKLSVHLNRTGMRLWQRVAGWRSRSASACRRRTDRRRPSP